MVLISRNFRFLLLPLQIINKPRFISKQSNSSVLLAEVGRLEQQKNHDSYETGQLFLHRIFGYRGVILFPWTARVYDRDLHNPKVSQKKTLNSGSASSVIDNDKTLKNTSSSDEVPTGAKNEDKNEATTGSKEVKGKMHTFYQVLIDSRDCPFIRAQTEAVTFLGHQDSNRSLYAVPGLDYVAHDDVLPYTSADRHPLFHELFDKFLAHAPEKVPPFEARETLKGWQEKNQQWLELSDVHKETTEKIRVTVIPFYMGCRETPASSVYWWRYCIRLENLGDMSVQLRERHWRIFSLSGTLETVRGRGVVGQEPILSTRLPAFQYSSHVSLQAPSGHMWGTFRLEREDGYTFDCKIPPFSLESKPDEMTPSTSTTTAATTNTTSNSSKSPPTGNSSSNSTNDDLE